MAIVEKPKYRSRVMVALDVLQAKQKRERKGDKVQDEGTPADTARHLRRSVENVKADLRTKAPAKKPAAKKKRAK